MKPKLIGSIRMATTVKTQLMESIMIRMPTMVVVEVISCVSDWFRFWLIVSTSLVMRLKISPCVFLSKYLIGSLLNFS